RPRLTFVMPLNGSLQSNCSRVRQNAGLGRPRSGERGYVTFDLAPDIAAAERRPMVARGETPGIVADPAYPWPVGPRIIAIHVFFQGLRKACAPGYHRSPLRGCQWESSIRNSFEDTEEFAAGQCQPVSNSGHYRAGFSPELSAEK